MLYQLHKLICLVIALLCAQALYCQRHYTDSMMRVIDTAKEDTSKVSALIKLGTELQQSDSAKSLQLYQQALAISKKVSNKKFEGLSLMNIGNWYCINGHYDTAKRLERQALSLAQQINNLALTASVTVNIGNGFYYQNQYDSAIHFYIAGAKLLEQLNDPVKLELFMEILA